jgi:AcrR family transcriptional regulator
VPEDSDRRIAIADAAIAIVSERGIRALTHRAVDQSLALPAGSTSYYVRTRRALLESVVTRLAERTAADMAGGAGGDDLPGRPADVKAGPGTHTRTEGPVGPVGGDRPGPDLIGELDLWSQRMGLLLDRMLGPRRADSLARYALSLELAADPELHRMLVVGQPIRARAEAALRRLGASDPGRQAADLVSCADGLVFDRLAGTRSLSGPEPGSARSIDELAQAMRMLLRGIFGV